jgi:hypothetical protein
MYPIDDSIRTLSDVEQIVSLCTRALDSADQLTRGAHARLVGHMLASTQHERMVPVALPAKKAKKDVAAEGDQDDNDQGSEQVMEVAKALMKPEEMLAALSTQYHKPSTSRKTRVGIFAFYQALFISLGQSFVESHYSLVFAHFMNDILASPKVTMSAFELGLAQKSVRVICRDLLGLRMLGEQAQIDAVLELTNTYIRRWPALLPGSIAPSSLILSSALDEVAGLLQQLGNAPNNVQVGRLFPRVAETSPHPTKF